MVFRSASYSPSQERLVPGTEVSWEPRLAPWPVQSGVPNWALHNPYYMCSLRRYQYLDRLVGPGYKPHSILPSEVTEFPAMVVPEQLSDDREPRVVCRHIRGPKDVLLMFREMRIVAQALEARLLEYEIVFSEQVSMYRPEMLDVCMHRWISS